ncbi:MAG TPA: AAA family ATPase [Phycisphaerae bacterium]|nr:AAA family ATPase [Phycisphaerae bacterium]
MGHVIRVIVFNADEDYGKTLRGELLAVDGLKILAEIDEPSLLPQAMGQFNADVVLVNLDPAPEPIMGLVRQVTSARAGLPVFVVSSSSDGDLVLAAMRAGVKEFLPKPIDRQQLTEALDRVAQQQPANDAQGRLISVMGSAGGVGATTVATNLAVELADVAGSEVAVVDLDFRLGQVATFFDVQANFTIADLCETHEQLDQQIISKAMVKHESGVHVLARPHHFAQAEQISAAHAAGMLAALQELYSYVVVDGPHRFDAGAQVVFDMADVNLLVMQLLVTSVRNSDRILAELAQHGYNLDRVHLVCNRSTRESGYLEPEHVEATLNRKIFWSIPSDFRAVCAAINLGEPLAMSASKSKVRQSLHELAERICNPEAAAEGGPPKKGAGVLRGLFSK